ncbi:hypothetical protein HXX01_05395 [Candidatus Nomurabacteria bacterium]|nr:hypothetical protein [Candidatus Nomurabacteria bacterium]
MSKNATAVQTSNSGTALTVVPSVQSHNSGDLEAVKPEIVEEKTDPTAVKPEVPFVLLEIPKPKELTLEDKIRKVENLQLIVNKRARIVEVRSELDRFQISSNDFNCKLRLTDSDGNQFDTSFTPGIKKVIEFLKDQFDESLRQIEEQITF